MHNDCCDEVQDPIQTRAIKPTRLVPSGVFSFRGEASIPYESPLEGDFLLLEAFDSDVIKIVPQPIKLMWQAASGRNYPYTPDFLVYRRTGQITLVEVKPRSEIRASWPQMKPKFQAALRYAKARGWAFRIYDDRRIRGPRLEAIKSLNKHKQFRASEEEMRAVLLTVRSVGCGTLDELIGLTVGLPTAVARNVLLHLVAHGRLLCDLEGPVTGQMRVWERT